jgi:hypothetical protein
MLSIKLIGLLNLREFAHLQFRNGETVLINSINNFTSLSVTVRFDHSESSFRFGFKLLSSEKITVFNEFKLSRVDVNDRSNEQYVGGDTWASHSFHEHSSIFKIILKHEKQNEIITCMIDLPFRKFCPLDSR